MELQLRKLKPIALSLLFSVPLFYAIRGEAFRGKDLKPTPAVQCLENAFLPSAEVPQLEYAKFIHENQSSPVEDKLQARYLESSARDTNQTYFFISNSALKSWNDELFIGIGGKELANAVHHYYIKTVLRGIREGFPQATDQVFCDFKTGRISFGHTFDHYAQDLKLQKKMGVVLRDADRAFFQDPHIQNIFQKLREAGKSEADLNQLRRAYSSAMGPGEIKAALTLKYRLKLGDDGSHGLWSPEIEAALLDESKMIMNENRRLVAIIRENGMAGEFIDKTGPPLPNAKLFTLYRKVKNKNNAPAEFAHLIAQRNPLAQTEGSLAIFASLKKLNGQIDSFGLESRALRTVLDYKDAKQGGVFSLDVVGLGAEDLYRRNQALATLGSVTGKYGIDEVISSVQSAFDRVTQDKLSLFSQVEKSLKKIWETKNPMQATGDDYIHRIASLTENNRTPAGVRDNIQKMLADFRRGHIPPGKIRTVLVTAEAVGKIESTVGGSLTAEYIVGIEKALKLTTDQLQGDIGEKFYLLPVLSQGRRPGSLALELHTDISSLDKTTLAHLREVFSSAIEAAFPARRAGDLKIEFIR